MVDGDDEMHISCRYSSGIHCPASPPSHDGESDRDVHKAEKKEKVLIPYSS
jgi:hypothetical protein